MISKFLKHLNGCSYIRRHFSIWDSEIPVYQVLIIKLLIDDTSVNF